MAVLVTAIHVLSACSMKEGVDARHGAGHDDECEIRPEC
jgi:hypothetical protein